MKYLRLLILIFIWQASPMMGANRPNILFLLSDDQRADTIAALGNREISTPNLDKLARNGVSFTRAYCMGAQQGAVCVPSRAMLMTGRTLFRATTNPSSGVIPNDALIWPEHFRRAGYETIGIGKWHNDKASFARGFSAGGPIFFGGMTDQFQVPVQPFDPAGVYARSNQFVTNIFSSELFANAAIEFLKGREKTNQPFFMYVAFTAPHDPRTPPGKYARLYSPERMKLPPNFMPQLPFDNGELQIRDEKLLPWPRKPEAVKKELADYYGMISHLDEQVGRILEELERGGLGRNTIIIFASDHGLAIGSHGLLGKQNLFEHSVRAPLILSGPGIPRNERTSTLVYLHDLFPTACDLAGVPRPMGLEGRSVAPILWRKQAEIRDYIFCAYRDVQRSIRDKRWKLIYYPKLGKSQLFDLKNDPYEEENLAGKERMQRKLRELHTRLREYQAAVGDPLVKR